MVSPKDEMAGKEEFIVLWVTEVDFYAKRGDEKGTRRMEWWLPASESNGLHSSSAFYEALRCWSFTIINCFHLVFMPDTFWAIHKIAICSAQHLKFPHVSYASSQHDSHIQRSSLRSSLVETKLAENFPPSDVVGKQKNCSGKKSYKNKLNNFRLLWGGSRDDKHFLYYPECSYAIV